MSRGLALPQVTLFHILIGNWFRSVSFQPTSIAAPPPEYTPPAAKVQALSFRLPYTRTGCQSIFFKRRLIRSFFRRMMHNKHEIIPYLNICLLFMQGLRQQKASGNRAQDSGPGLCDDRIVRKIYGNMKKYHYLRNTVQDAEHLLSGGLNPVQAKGTTMDGN